LPGRCQRRRLRQWHRHGTCFRGRERAFRAKRRPWTHGDANGDGFINQQDLKAVTDHFGKPCASVSIPELIRERQRIYTSDPGVSREAMMSPVLLDKDLQILMPAQILKIWKSLQWLLIFIS